MPGFDGSGPRGGGPLTGGGRGFCGSPVGRGLVAGGGNYRVRGGGRGRGFGWRAFDAQTPRSGIASSSVFPANAGTAEQELDRLRNRAANFQNELAALQQRIRDLEAS